MQKIHSGGQGGQHNFDQTECLVSLETFGTYLEIQVRNQPSTEDCS